MDRARLVGLIRAAWAHARPPDAANIASPTYDDEGVRAGFAGRAWDAFGARELRLLDFAPCIFTQEAFAYYLPAYLIADIESPDVSDTNMERVLFWLDPDHLRDPQASARPVIDRLNKQQRAALQAYVVFVRDREQGLYDRECDRLLALLGEAGAV